jgi:hypothetical protein
MYYSIPSPSENVWYIFKTLGSGGVMSLSRVTMDSKPEMEFKGNSPAVPSSLLRRKLMEMRGTSEQIKLPGAGYVGLSFPTICDFIQQMDGAEESVKYMSCGGLPFPTKSAV